MDLRDAGAGERLGAEVGEDLLERAPQRRLDDAARLFEGDLRDAVLQGLELVAERLRDEVGARGEDLAQLHEGRAQVLQRGGDALEEGERWDLGFAAIDEQPDDGLVLEVPGLDDVSQTVAHEDRGDLPEADHVLDGRAGGPEVGVHGAHRRHGAGW